MTQRTENRLHCFVGPFKHRQQLPDFLAAIQQRHQYSIQQAMVNGWRLFSLDAAFKYNPTEYCLAATLMLPFYLHGSQMSGQL